MKSFKYLLSVITVFILTTNIVLAVELKNPLGEGVSLEKAVSNIVSAALGISGVLALVAFVYGGILWMTSGGNSNRVEKGKTVMIWAVFGIVIIFSSYAILNFVFNALLNTSGAPTSL